MLKLFHKTFVNNFCFELQVPSKLNLEDSTLQPHTVKFWSWISRMFRLHQIKQTLLKKTYSNCQGITVVCRNNIFIFDFK